jgi:hypothetical protein
LREMSIVLEANLNHEVNLHVKELKEGIQGSLGDVGSTVIGSSNGSGSAGNVGSIENVGSIGNVGSNGNVGSLGYVASLGNLANPEDVGSAGKLIGSKHLDDAKNFDEAGKLGASTGTLGPFGVSSATAAMELVAEPPVVYRTYKYRWVILLCYAGITNAGGIMGAATIPIITNLQEIYGISFNFVNLTNLMGMILYIPASIPGNYILDRYGIKKGLFLGTILMLVGSWIRLLASKSFTYVLIGTIITSLGGPLLSNCPQKISAYWNSPKQRTMFTVLLMLTGVVGGSIGMLLPGYLVGEESSPDKGKELFVRLLLIEGIIGTVLCVPIFIFFREKPPTPPSASASVPREDFKKGIRL